jgi:HPt (histidine-containing phosphotransfer) domain-containing protein
MTAHAMRGDREKCLQAGMDGYVSKPIHQQELWNALQSVVSARSAPRRSDSAPEQVPVNGDPESPDWSTALKAVGGDSRLLLEVVQAFLEECPRLLDELEPALQRNDAPAVQRIGHTIKGTLRLFNVPRLSELAHRVEVLGREQKLPEAPAAAEQLRHHINLFLPQLRSWRP